MNRDEKIEQLRARLNHASPETTRQTYGPSAVSKRLKQAWIGLVVVLAAIPVAVYVVVAVLLALTSTEAERIERESGDDA